MKQFINRALAAVFALSLICGSASVALADRGGNGHGHGNSAKAHAKVSTSVHGKSASHANSSVRDNDSDSRVASSHGKSATAHSCINPAGNTRGWCKTHAGGAFVTGTVTGINGNTAIVRLPDNREVSVNAGGLTVGQQVTLRGNWENSGVFVPNNGAYTTYNGPYSSASVRGLIISVNGNSIQIAQGLSLIAINDANAAARGAISGVLYPGRTITAAGNWNGSTFIANSIQ